MKKLAALLIGSLFLGNILFSQKKLSLSASVGLGSSSFRGPGSTGRSAYYRNGLSFPYDIDTMVNPYGRKPFTDFVAGLQADLKVLPKWFLICNVSYEYSGARLNGDSVITPSGNFRTKGDYVRYYSFISLNPQVGRIVFDKAETIILHAGIDYTFKLERGDQFQFLDQSNKHFTIGHSGGQPEVNDFRFTGGAGINWKAWGVDLNFKKGITNYNKYGNGKVYSRLFQVKFLYAFLNK